MFKRDSFGVGKVGKVVVNCAQDIYQILANVPENSEISVPDIETFVRIKTLKKNENFPVSMFPSKEQGRTII